MFCVPATATVQRVLFADKSALVAVVLEIVFTLVVWKQLGLRPAFGTSEWSGFETYFFVLSLILCVQVAALCVGVSESFQAHLNKSHFENFNTQTVETERLLEDVPAEIPGGGDAIETVETARLLEDVPTEIPGGGDAIAVSPSGLDDGA